MDARPFEAPVEHPGDPEGGEGDRDPDSAIEDEVIRCEDDGGQHRERHRQTERLCVPDVRRLVQGQANQQVPAPADPSRNGVPSRNARVEEKRALSQQPPAAAATRAPMGEAPYTAPTTKDIVQSMKEARGQA